MDKIIGIATLTSISTALLRIDDTILVMSIFTMMTFALIIGLTIKNKEMEKL